jgi:transcriptional regulator with XRE-family HTH domain
MELIEQLREKIKAEGLTQHQVCREINCQAASLNRWLLGKGKPSYAWQELIKNYLKKDVEISK